MTSEEISRLKLVDCYMRLYTIEKIVFTNVVKLKLLITMRVHPVMNMSQVVRY